MTNSVARGDSIRPMEDIMRANGSIIWLMAQANNTWQKLGAFTKANGRRILSMDLAEKTGQMVHGMKETINMALNQDMGDTITLTALNIMETSKIIYSMET